MPYQLSRTHMSSHGLKWKTQGLHGSAPGPCTHVITIGLVFVGLLMKTSLSQLFLWPLKLFLLLIFILQPQYKCFHLVLMCLDLSYLGLLYWRPALTLNGKEWEVDLRKSDGGEESTISEDRRNYGWDVLYERRI